MDDSANSLLHGDPRQNLLEAAKLVEDAAYEMATSQSSRLVSELIVIAADLDRIASSMAHHHGKRDGAARG
ncbi:hypothetical protein BOO69_04385 [Sulfitobacter alexandrii]|uniref:Uncharacterized protein n=1 Tax=Sulfitobacter alexandrii TaxID=1917485 RepID=A0A1J0WEJ7_9RHOB|nr:hypothetical protein [Sulfitobacter alexandrii]APE42743.1 hypothetical protein BOO69_04385 [Sulfitobacter alexandrii]